jgi:lysophospholipase L1-like esterase
MGETEAAESVGSSAAEDSRTARSGEGAAGEGALETLRGFQSFVALGDSFTEGMVDELPDGSLRGWADLVAERLSRFEPGFRYANLAVRGRLVRQIGDDQVPMALRMGADLVTLAAGLNDVGRPGCDIEAVCAQLEQCAAALTAAGARVVMFQSIDFTYRMPSLKRFEPRVRRLMEAVEGLRDRYGVVVVDLSVERAFDDPRLWAPDRVHLATEGHLRIAEAVLEALGYERSFDWHAPLPPRKRPWAVVRAWSNVVWTLRFLAPWLKRRMTGTSSGDGMTAKRPELTPVQLGWATDGPVGAAGELATS